MARLQDYPSVTPNTANDNLLIVQSAGQGNAKIDAVGQKIATDTTHSGLTTTSKKLVGAINELNANKVNKSAISNLITLSSSSGSVASFSTDVADKLFSCYVDITGIQFGSGTPSPDNIMPIRLWSAGNVRHSSKNLVNLANKTISQAAYIYENEPVIIPKGDIIISFTSSVDSGQYSIAFKNNGNTVGTTGGTFVSGRNAKAVTLTNTCTEISIYSAVSGTFTDFMVELGTTATTFAAFVGNAKTFAFGQLVAKGTIDVLNGLVTISRLGKVLDGTEDWAFQSQSTNNNVFKLANAMTPSNQNDQVCSHFRPDGSAYQGDDNRASTFIQGTSGNLFIQVLKTLAADATAFKTWLANQYSGGTPVTYWANINNITVQLDGYDIRTFGTARPPDNIFADCGNINLKYLETIGNLSA